VYIRASLRPDFGRKYLNEQGFPLSAGPPAQETNAMVSIRLARHGAKKAPVYRVVAADVRAPRDGRFIEILGTYTATGTNAGVNLKLDRIDYWLGQGAKATDAVARLVKQVRNATPADA